MYAPGERTIEVVVFDFDGTLADTSHAIVATTLQTLDELRLPPFSAERIVAMMGLPLAQVFIEAGVAPHATAGAVARYRERFPSNLARVALFPAVRECLSALSEARIPMGVVSSRGRHSLLDLLDRLRIRGLFREVIGEEDVVGKKPLPDGVLALSKQLGVAVERILVVGDTTYDIEMGHAAGALTCAVTYGSHDALRLSGVKPTYQLDSLAGLLGLLNR